MRATRGTERQDIHDGAHIYDSTPWTEMVIRDLKDVISNGGSQNEAAEFLCRPGTIQDVACKCEELGLKPQAK